MNKNSDAQVRKTRAENDMCANLKTTRIDVLSGALRDVLKRRVAA
ncbi:hypothetical protein UNDYM_3974 [Undibacterium sp. YM2]|nr:hypothetical protein [Undibacterium sp. YM2]BBB68227.1 hypothetical protein UNDYM_3974 [Undibacterium sp. YM2]